MDLLRIYKIISEDLIEIAESVVSIEVTENDPLTPYIRLKEEPYVLTESVREHSGIVTAHKLEDYINRFHSIRLRNQSSSWLDDLIEGDIKRKELLHEISRHDAGVGD